MQACPQGPINHEKERKTNHKEKNHPINRSFISLVAAMCFVCLLLPNSAKAGPTTGQLQQQIDELTAHVNRLRALIEDPNEKSYFAGIAGIISDYEDCTDNEYGLNCEEKTAVIIDVLEDQELNFEMLFTDTDMQHEAIELKIEKLPRDNPLTSRDYQVDVEIKWEEDVNNFSISPEDPIYSFSKDPCYPKTGPFKNLRCELVTDWRIRIIGDFNSVVNQIKTESFSSIVEAHIEPCTESATKTELKVHIANYGDLRSTYIVTATDFGPSIEPVLAEYVTLDQFVEATLTLPIRTVDTFAGQGPCLITLKSNAGRRYDTTTADFPSPLPDGPAPEYIPDFDGDGDVDFGDFSHFGLFWLEQPDT
jgi:hypothetical protein